MVCRIGKHYPTALHTRDAAYPNFRGAPGLLDANTLCGAQVSGPYAEQVCRLLLVYGIFWSMMLTTCNTRPEHVCGSWQQSWPASHVLLEPVLKFWPACPHTTLVVLVYCNMLLHNTNHIGSS
jgi:hypothetical protein